MRKHLFNVASLLINRGAHVRGETVFHIKRERPQKEKLHVVRGYFIDSSAAVIIDKVHYRDGIDLLQMQYTGR